ncbi:uracil-DNA glycosylase family protein [Thermoproteota archaeon]
MQNETIKMMSLFDEIAHCSNIMSCFDNRNKNNHCTNIVMSQNEVLFNLKIPEPWSGHLNKAPVLFLGSNPSISSNDRNPRWKSPNAMIKDFFIYRFGEGNETWVKNGIHILDSKGRYDKKKWVRYWASVRSRYAELARKEKNSVRPGIDYSMSEVVHCKSKYEKHVRSASKDCVKLYLRSLITTSAAKIIVCMGKHAQDSVCEKFSLKPDEKLHDPIKIGNIRRWFVFLPHPNSRRAGGRTFEKTLRPKQLEDLRKVLSLSIRNSEAKFHKT